MKKKRFLKLSMIYAIIKGRTVVYNADISIEGIKVRTDKSCVINCQFNMVGVKNKNEVPIIGNYDNL